MHASIMTGGCDEGARRIPADGVHPTLQVYTRKKCAELVAPICTSGHEFMNTFYHSMAPWFAAALNASVKELRTRLVGMEHSAVAICAASCQLDVVGVPCQAHHR